MKAWKTVTRVTILTLPRMIHVSMKLSYGRKTVQVYITTHVTSQKGHSGMTSDELRLEVGD